MKKLIPLFIILVSLFLAFWGIMTFVIFPQGKKQNEAIMTAFAEMIGEENYTEFTSEYNIIFMDCIPFVSDSVYGDININYKQVRIKNASDTKMLISLCHEYGHYICERDNLTENEEYKKLFEEHKQIYYGKYNLTYDDINEYIASYIGAKYYNK